MLHCDAIMPLLQMLALMALGADAAQATEHASADPLTAMLVEGGLATTNEEDFDVADLAPTTTSPRHAGFSYMVVPDATDLNCPGVLRRRDHDVLEGESVAYVCTTCM